MSVVGNRCTILQAASLGGTTFATTHLPSIGTPRWIVSSAANPAVVLSVAAPRAGYDPWASAIANGLTSYGDCAAGDGSRTC